MEDLCCRGMINLVESESGSIKLKMFDGVVRILKNVRFTPELKRNLISFGSLNLLGYEFNTKNGFILVRKGGKTVMKGKKEIGLYILLGNSISGSTDVVMSESDGKMWHKSLGHIGERGLNELANREAFGESKTVKLDFCDHCVLGNARKRTFEKGVHSTQQPLNYIHSDIWGPSRVETHSGGKYFITIIDNYSMKMWVIILKQSF